MESGVVRIGSARDLGEKRKRRRDAFEQSGTWSSKDDWQIPRYLRDSNEVIKCVKVVQPLFTL